MKIDSLPDPIPGDPGALRINPATSGLMIFDGERYIPLTVLRSADARRLPCWPYSRRRLCLLRACHI